MSAPEASQQQILAHAIRALGGTWDPQRGVTVFRDHGHEWEDQQTAEKRVRGIYRKLATAGLIVKTDPGRAIYRIAGGK